MTNVDLSFLVLYKYIFYSGKWQGNQLFEKWIDQNADDWQNWTSAKKGSENAQAGRNRAQAGKSDTKDGRSHE